MPSGIRIDDLRLSFIWTETVLDFIHDAAPSSSPLAFLGHTGQYIAAFRQALEEGSGPAGLQVPWKPRKEKQHFWSYYLETRIPGHISGKQVWKKLVPFYSQVPATPVKAPWLPGRLVLQAFYYPHSIALVVTAECRSDLTLEEAVNTAFKIRRTGRFQVRWADRETTEDLSLDNLANEGSSALHRFALGPEAPPRAGEVKEPFTVATVVSGRGVEKNDSPPEEVLCALHAVTGWPSYDWQDPPPSDLPSLDHADQEKTKAAYPGDVLYIRKRGRGVWFPKHFCSESGRRAMLSCYHRNLVLLSMQIESLGDLVFKAAQQIRAGTPPIPGSPHESYVKRAAINLSLLYAGGGTEKSTYRSWSARRQIEQNNLVPAVNVVRDRLCDRGPLSP